MGRKKDSLIWAQFETANGVSKCKHCDVEFKGNPSSTRLRKHLLGIPDGGIRICTKVPDHVKRTLTADGPNKRPRIGSSSNNNDEVVNILSTSAPQHNSEFQNPRQDEERMQVEFEGNDNNLEGHNLSEDPAIYEEIAAILHQTPDQVHREQNILEANETVQSTSGLGIVEDHDARETKINCVDDAGLNDPVNRPHIELGSSNDYETNNLMATSTQLNDNFENQVQYEGMMQPEIQGINQEFFEGVDELIEEMRASSETNSQPLITTKMVGRAFELNKDMVCRWVTRDEISSIGIYGMGGVGKTTLVTHIYNKILENPLLYGDAYWITVSQDFSIERLQNLVAKSINLDFGHENDEKKRAAKLFKELSEKRKFVLILDDLWNHFDVRRVGIPVDASGCKLIVTSRSFDVCRRTNCQKKLKVQPLLEDEAWELFLDTLGHDLTPEVKQIARFIVQECDGLPLGIVTMAGSMREIDDIHDWNTALTELQIAEVRPDDMEPDVFRILRFSYARLNDLAQQKCLLYCSLYPEDFEIKRDELIKHLIVEGIVKRTNSWVTAFDKGHSMINKLENVCLLEHIDGKSVKMHDLIRDMAIQILKESLPSLVEAGKQLRGLPKEIYWTEDLVQVSLMNNYIEEIPSHHSPRCPNLSNLLLCGNRELKRISEQFFCQMQGLKVLNLSKTSIVELPESVANLKNLIALFLKSCQYLREVPSLAKLGALEVLDLFNCQNVEEVPKGWESLSNLKYLNLEGTKIKQLPTGMLRKLSYLQFLAFMSLHTSRRGVNGEEVACLVELETLKWCFDDYQDFIKFISTMHREMLELREYILLVSSENYFLGFVARDEEFTREIFFRDCILEKEVLLPKNVQLLDIIHCSIDNGRSLCLNNVIGLKHFEMCFCNDIENLCCSLSIFQTLESVKISHMMELRDLFISGGDLVQLPPTPFVTVSLLKHFEIIRCSSMKKLFSLGLLPNLQNLQVLIVRDCPCMEELIVAEELEEGSHNNPQFSLPNLRELSLQNLPNLKSICSAEIKCESLREISFYDCTELKNILISLPLPSLQRLNVHPRSWWALVEWGNI